MQPTTFHGVRPFAALGIVGFEVLIRWKGLLAYEDSCETFETVQTQFPHFILEDKVVVWAASNDRP